MERDMSLLYKVIRNKLDNTYKNVFNQNMREDKPGDVGIYLYESSNDSYDLCGDDIYNCIKVQLQVNAGPSAEELETALLFLSHFVDRIENEQSDIENISIISAQHIGPRAIPIGKNDFNITVCKSTVDLKYIFTM